MLTLLKNRTVYLDDIEYIVINGSPTEDTLLENRQTGERVRISTYNLVAKYLCGDFRTASQHKATLRKVSAALPDSCRFQMLSALARSETHRRVDYITRLERTGAFFSSKDKLRHEVSKIAAERGEHHAPTLSTIYRWNNKYVGAMRDVRALIAGFDSQGGKGESRIDPIVERFIDDAIETITIGQRRSSAQHVFDAVRLEVDRANQTREEGLKLTPPSLRTVQRRVSLVSALDLEIAQTSPEFAKRKFKHLQNSRQVTRILELVEIDHTPADIIVLNDDRKTAGRPDMTIVLDRRSRCVLGFHLSLAGHGVPAVFEALRHALLPKTYLKDTYAELGLTWPCFGWFERVLMDNGPEFHAEAVADALLSLGIATEFAPSREPNAKPFVERFNRRINYELIHTLPGSTLDHHHKRVGFDPYKDAALTLEELDRACHRWICEKYHRRPHRGLGGRSPLEVWEEGAKICPPQLKMNMEDIDIEFCEVTTSRVQHYGIDLNNSRYDSSQLQNLRACMPRDSKVTVKWARRDVGFVWIWDSINQEFFKAQNREPDFNGVTLEQAKAHRANVASNDAKADLRPARADEAVREMANEAMKATKHAQRRKGERLANKTSKDFRESSSETLPMDRPVRARRTGMLTADSCSQQHEDIPEVEVELPADLQESFHEN